MKKLKRLLYKASVPALIFYVTLSTIYEKPDGSDKIMIGIYGCVFLVISIIISKNEKDKN